MITCVQQLFSFGAYLEGDDGEMGELQAGFDGDGTGTETDVPEDTAAVQRSEEHTSDSSHIEESRMPSSA